jgi:hypothetical protein
MAKLRGRLIMEIVNQAKSVIFAAIQQGEAELKEWGDLCLTKAANEILEKAGEPLPADEVTKTKLLSLFTQFEKSPIGFAEHVKNTFSMFSPLVPKSKEDLKNLRNWKKQSAKIVLNAANKI